MSRATNEYHEIICSIDDLGTVRAALEAKFKEAEKSGFTWKPNVMAPVDEEAATAVFKLIDMLEDNDDVQNVITNFEVSEELMTKLAAAG